MVCALAMEAEYPWSYSAWTSSPVGNNSHLIEMIIPG